MAPANVHDRQRAWRLLPVGMHTPVAHVGVHLARLLQLRHAALHLLLALDEEVGVHDPHKGLVGELLQASLREAGEHVGFSAQANARMQRRPGASVMTLHIVLGPLMNSVFKYSS